MSLLNSEAPGPVQLLTGYISLVFHSTLSAATGKVATETISRTINQGGYFLVVEGAVPAAMPKACLVGGTPFTEQVLVAAKNSKAVISVGTCATFGGIPAAENNPTGAMGIAAYLEKEKISQTVINVPGCPTHPDWVVGTIVHVLKFGMPSLDEKNRPIMFYGKTIHEQCPRFRDYERENFAKRFSDDGCLFELGCQGPSTFADCTTRQWNSGVNSCINAGAPCIGCAAEDFAAKTDFPLYTKLSTIKGR